MSADMVVWPSRSAGLVVSRVWRRSRVAHKKVVHGAMYDNTGRSMTCADTDHPLTRAAASSRKRVYAWYDIA